MRTQKEMFGLDSSKIGVRARLQSSYQKDEVKISEGTFEDLTITPIVLSDDYIWLAHQQELLANRYRNNRAYLYGNWTS